MYDLILRRGRIIDGTGAAWFEGDVAIKGDRIAAMGNLREAKATREVQLNGEVIAPGFIDIHTHSDLPLLVNPRAEAKIRQGVTTEVVGNCGSSYAPLMGDAADSVLPNLKKHGLDLTWSSMRGYLDRMEEGRPAQNVAALIGLGVVRRGVVGSDDRPPTADELNRMKEVIAQAMAEGAFGISSGLIYPPGSFAKVDELVELSKVVHEYGGFYATHMRNEADHVIEAVAEAIEIGERSGAPVQISHHKALGPANWGKVRTTVGMMEDARRRGLEVTMDQYPYTASSTSLSTLLPQWAHDGGREALLARLRDPETRSRLTVESERIVQRSRGGWDKVFLAGLSPEYAHLEGVHLLEAARLLGRAPVDCAFDLLLAHGGNVRMVAFGMSEEDVRYVMQHPLTMIASDGNAIAPYGTLGEGRPHPRSYGTFVRVLGRYVREDGVLALEEAVRKMTSLPARKLGLWDRGILRPGMAADIVVFDPGSVRDQAEFNDPHRYAAGVKLVIVNGVPVVEEGEHTGAGPGRALRRGQGVTA